VRYVTDPGVEVCYLSRIPMRVTPLGKGQMAIDIARRKFVSTLGGGMIAWPLAARAQQSAVPVIGVLGSASATADKERLKLIGQGLAESGFTEGRNVAMDYQWAEGQLDRLPALAAELVGRRPNVIIATGGLQTPRAAMSATSTIPIVFSTDGDPVKQGLVASLNRPGGNATGITVFSATLTAKRLELFRVAVPGAEVFAILVNPTAGQAAEQIADAQASARVLGLEMRVINARSDAEFVPALAAFAEIRNAALVVAADPLFLARRDALVSAANQHQIPATYGRRDFVVAGGLMSYGANLAEPYRLMGAYAGRILKGEKPADLPVQEPTKFELVLNLKTAKMLGLTVPPSLLAIADEVIE
jgi:putative ABC transport system substrate-binding protein